MMSPIRIWQESFQTDIRVVQSFNQLSNQQVPVSSKLTPRIDRDLFQYVEIGNSDCNSWLF